ncbi:kelch-like protein 26 [Gigantopelta aegis]|uniref:kelch-like protein 26 n=1 Tax=Gigantopelta aegis TaxID=1735272 RepID=UPI001B88B388|nr:kelch-like protein 26 [Gigantopelta aegis]XP_041375351.1 kelch-like protein 26 [Gigantopelta aegis]XP_041375352.1 kelch-like protein 26 [Gigantopelta aegis]XP_041375353.1 kelch-like protein 26 [Gigantopelta aegis]XP_041375354.1 kelch-like protein 26 [Gigantopelta aegis]
MEGQGDSFEFKATNHGDVLLAGLRHLRDKQQLFDVVLVVEKQKLPAHRVVLASCSDYFRAMFTDGLKECHQEEIVLSGVTAKGMANLVDFAYTSKSNIDCDSVVDVLGAASHIQILPVIAACEDYLKKHLSLDNCVDIANVAELYTLKPLEQFVFQFMCKNWHEFCSCHDFHRLRKSQLLKLLKSGFPVDCSELDIFLSILNWVDHDVEDRHDCTLQVLDKVLFENISLQELQSVCHNSVFKDICSKVPGLSKLINSFINTTECTKDCEARVPGSITCPNLCKCIARKSVPGIGNLRGFQQTVLVAGGFSNETGMTSSVWYLDQSSSLLKHLTKIPHVDQCNFGMAAHNNKLYVIGGCFNDQMQEIVHPFGFCYDPAEDSWKSIAQMTLERCRFVLGVADGYLYAVGGDPHASDIQMEGAPCERYDPRTDRWEEIEPLPGGRTQHAGTTLDNRLYICGGFQEDEGVLDDLWCFNADSNQWERGSSLLVPRADHAMFTHGNKIYVIGGWYYDPNTRQRVMASSIDCYDVDRMTWETVGSLNESRLYATYTLLNNVIHVVGGWRNGKYRQKCRSIDKFDLDTRRWTKDQDQDLELWEHNTCCLYLPKSLSY